MTASLNTEKAKVLIVDDIEANRIAMEDTLSDMDADLYLAGSGLEALELITAHQFALILLDVQMPEMDGFETAELMRKNKHTEAIPIVFITAINKEKIHLFKGYEAGAVDYLFKPVDPYILKSKIKFFLDIFYQKTQKLMFALDELQSAKEELEKNNERLQKAAMEDSLTSLPNRYQFEIELSRTLAFSDRYSIKFVIMMIDLDNFKTINDTAGHMVGDKLLQLVSSKLRVQVREEDFVARLGGDEFAIILTKVSNYDDAGRIANNICLSLQEPMQIDDSLLRISSSVGVACFPFAGNTAEELLRHADIAMYRATKNGKNTFEYFSKALSLEYARRTAIESALRGAIENEEFCLVFQIIYDLTTKKPYGVETLIRWRSPELGEVSPEEFIPISEDIGLIDVIGRWVIEKACKCFSKWHDSGVPYVSYAINISPRQLLKKDMFDFTQKIMQRENIPPGKVELELTETALMEKSGVAEALLDKFDQVGVRINIDDFGTGYSSLIRLRNLSIHALKIDRSFVSDILLDKSDAIIVKAILSLASSLGLKTIAEGIEDKQQLDFLCKHGCSYGQGYYLEKPLTADEVQAILLEDRLYGE